MLEYRFEVGQLLWYSSVLFFCAKRKKNTRLQKSSVTLQGVYRKLIYYLQIAGTIEKFNLGKGVFNYIWLE